MRTASRRSPLLERLPALLLVVGLAWGLSATSQAAPETSADAGWTRTVTAVDAAIAEKLSEAGAASARASDDAEFLRRVTLDLTGTIPTADEARAFLASKAPDKRAQKIEALLASPAYAEFWSHWWYRVLTGMTPNSGQRQGDQARLLRGPADETFQAWLAQQFGANAPYDKFATALITATGRTNENGATGWFARWDGKPNDLAGALSKTFLGVKIQCAQCHDHMYEPTWKQKDFQGMASFFVLAAARPIPEYQQAYREVERMREERMKEMGEDAPDKDGNGKPDKKALLDGELRKDPKLRDALRNRYVMDITDAEPSALARGRGRVPKDKIPEALQERVELASVTPKAWMGPSLPDLPGLTRREMLARWVTSADNPYFARALVNRYWGHLFGRGLVDPVDDFTSMNPPSHPALLDLLAGDLRANGYDLKRLLRILANSAAYQRTSVWTGKDEPDPALFARAAVKSLSNEQLFHALVTATGTDGMVDRAGRRDALASGYGRGRDAVFSAFTFLFDDDEGAEADEFAGSIPQGLFLMNGRMIQGALSGLPGATVSRALADEPTDAARVERLYLSAYGRAPDADERRAALAYVKQGNDERAGWQDLFWVLLNSAEFMSNH